MRAENASAKSRELKYRGARAKSAEGWSAQEQVPIRAGVRRSRSQESRKLEYARAIARARARARARSQEPGARSQEPEAKRAKGPASKEEFVPIEGIDSVCP